MRTIKKIKSILKSKNKKHNMKTLQIEECKAKELYKTASPEFKAMLEDSFGIDFFKSKIMDRVKNFADICLILGTTQGEFNAKFSSYEKDTKAYEKLKLITKVLNEGWTPNWSDKNEKKWYPWFEFNNGAGAFVCSKTLYGWTYTITDGGSRLRFKSAELAKFAGELFQKEYNEFLLM